MTESLFIFGNGLGRSIDNDAYQLNTAMQAVWDKGDNGLSDMQKEIILKALALEGDDIGVGPQEESQIKTIQEVIFACELLQKIEDVRLPFATDETRNTLAALTKEARELPDALRTYVRQVASQFVDTDNHLTGDFCTPLFDFVYDANNIAHIATTNYDELLYTAYGQQEGRDDKYKLIDGFHNTVEKELVFDPVKSQENYINGRRRRGWYLHLHGSPLYVDNGSQVRKLRLSDFRVADYTCPGHIVLTHHAFKRRIIEESHILNAYWNIFCEKLFKSTNIILFGMSGDDVHINKAIRDYAREDAIIRIVDWTGESDNERDKKEDLWKGKLGENRFKTENLILLPNVQDFTDWALNS